MSLLDDVSIVVTPNGYKAGELYAVIPVPTEGTELVTNGDFATDTDWSKGANWTISGGSATSDGTDATSNLSQTVTSFTDKRFVVDGVASNVTQGFAYISLGGSDLQIVVNSNGAFKHYVTISSGNSTLFISARNNFIGSIDNVSVKEYTSADMDVTRATAATRVDENGLVNYAEVLGDNLTTPLDFTTWINSTATDITANSFTTSGSGRGVFFNLTTNKLYKINVSGVTGDISLRYRDGGGGGTVLGAFDTDLYFDTSGLTSPNIYLRALSATTATVTSVSVKEVTRDNVPRIDYTGGGCPHILAEPQRTNLITTSASGSYGNPPASEINTTAPDGTNDAIRPVPNSLSDRYEHNIAGGTYSSGDKVTYSWYRKRFSTPVTDVYIGDLNVNALVNCTQVGITTEIASSINGYDRFSATLNITDGSLVSTLRFYFGGAIGIGNSSVAYWGHQLETGSYATSYIPTSGSTVTRNQDIFTRDGIGSLINSTEGVLFVEMAALSNDGTFRQLTLNDGTTANRILVDFTDASNQIRVFCGSGGVSQVSETFNVTSSLSFNKIAFKYKLNDFALWVNGVEVATDTSGITPIGLNKLSFNNGSGSFDFFGKVKQLQVYDTALTDMQLIQLTGTSGTDFYESYSEMAESLTYTIQ